MPNIEQYFKEKLKKAKDDTIGQFYNIIAEEAERRQLQLEREEINTEEITQFSKKATKEELNKFIQILTEEIQRRK